LLVRILVADDDEVARLVVQAALSSLGHDCDLAPDGTTAWETFNLRPYDVVITDRAMPGMSGLELTTRIREHPAGRRTYILLLTGLDGTVEALEGVSAGADDYLSKPLSIQSLQMRLIAAARITALHQRIESMTAELERMAQTDPLTNLGNRLALHEELTRLDSFVRRYGRSYCLALIDVDQFKSFNDTYGHLAGDQALVAVADVLGRHGRTSDRAYRYGGEEFVVVLPEQDEPGALTVLERLRRGVHQLGIPHEGSSHHVVTVSLGAALLRPSSQETAEQALAGADEALYRAKAAGRNCLVHGW
jgi:diguanylate cyclase (GGDEF)-like protein